MKNNEFAFMLCVVVFLWCVGYFFLFGDKYVPCDREHYPELEGNMTYEGWHYYKSWEKCCLGGVRDRRCVLQKVEVNDDLRESKV